MTARFLDSGMASRAKTVPLETTALQSTPVMESGTTRTTERAPRGVLERVSRTAGGTDLVLFTTTAERDWALRLSDRMRSELHANRQLTIEVVNLNVAHAAGILEDAEYLNRSSRFLGLVISAQILRENWSSLERGLVSHPGIGGGRARIVTLLKENVTMPPALRLRDWIDFRDGIRYDQGVRELAALVCGDQGFAQGSARLTTNFGAAGPAASGWRARPLFAGARTFRERIVANLFPVVEIPRDFLAIESRFRSESEIANLRESPGPLPFLLRNAKLYTIASAPVGAALVAAAKEERCNGSHEQFKDWLSDSSRAPLAVELLNRLLRHHAWKRGLRFDESHGLYYFTRTKPKKLWWEIGGKTIQRQVTAANMKWAPVEGGGAAEFQCGWRHEAIRAEFVQVCGELFLKLEPAWFLTELDGRTPATAQPVAPQGPYVSARESNGHCMRALRFWSTVLAKGHQELRIETGTNPIRVRLTPAAGSSLSAASHDRMDFDALATVDCDGFELIPDLVPVFEDSGEAAL